MMWWRVIAAMVAILLAFAVLDTLDLGGMLGARSAEDARDHAPLSAGRQLFWSLLFVAVFLTSLLAAARRGVLRLRQAVGLARQDD